MSLYLDTNVVVGLFIVDAHSDASERLLATSSACVISDLVAAEFVGVIGRRFRAGRLTRDEARAAIADFGLWAEAGNALVPVERADYAEALRLLDDIDTALSTPDALHIALARRLGLTLATFDKGMAAAARALGLAVAGA